MTKTPDKKITDENIGTYIELFSAKSGFEGQDGGMVTALLVWGMKKDVFDSAVLVERKDSGDAEAVIARGIDDIISARGTKYFKVDTASKLKELLDQGSKRIAVVCTPCQVRAVRKIQENLKHNSSNVELTIIGLFCLESFSYIRLESEIKRLLGVDLNSAKKSQIHKGTFTVHLGEKKYSCKVSDLSYATEKGCAVCGDFSAQLADISIGSVGSQRGYSTVIVRTATGKTLLEGLNFEKTGAEKSEIKKLEKFKKERAEKRARIFRQQTGTFGKPT